MADPRRARIRRRNRVIVGTAIGVAICLAGGGAAWAALRPQGPSYRVATAQKADVTQTASLAGTVASATRADRAFQVSGTVAAVDVKVGDKVTAGQRLATLNTSVLTDSVTQAQQAVTSAQQTLSDDLASQTASASTVSATAASATDAADGGLATASFLAASSTTIGAAAGTTPNSVQSALATVTAAQNALVTDGNAVTTAQQTLTGDLAQISTTAPASGSGTACYQFLQAKVSTTDPTQAQTDITNAQSELTSCQTAVTTVLSDEQAVAAAQQKVQSDVTALNNAVTALQAAVTAAQSSAPTPSSSPTSSTPQPTKSSQPSSPSSPSKAPGAKQSGGSGSGSSGQHAGGSGSGRASGAGSSGGFSGAGGASGSGSADRSGGTSGSRSGGSGTSSGGLGGSGSGKSSGPASAEQIVADQASLASAQANLAVAQQNVGLATLTTPISGTVAAVGIAAGSSVTAQSTSQVISIIGGDGWVIDTAVAATAVGPLKVGQPAQVEVSGVSGTQTGTITSIGFLNTATDSSTPSYDVTLSLAGSGAGLLNGASARLTVSIDKASGVLTVPSSAVHLGAGNSYSVDVLSDGREATRAVQVGAIGSDRTQITSGLSAGDRVVLADLSSTVSSDSTQSTTGGAARFGGGAGGFRGAGGAGAGGFGGGARQLGSSTGR